MADLVDTEIKLSPSIELTKRKQDRDCFLEKLKYAMVSKESYDFRIGQIRRVECMCLF